MTLQRQIMRNFNGIQFIKQACCLMLSMALYASSLGQQSDKSYKNVIRYSLSNALIFGPDKSIIFGYERVVKPHQSFSINLGPTALPGSSSFTSEDFSLQKTKKSSGFNVSVDYRFYLAGENKHPAPHGVYIGPYYSYNRFNKENTWNYAEAGNPVKTATTQMDFDIHTVGIQLGYQFVLWKRLTLDFDLVGPGIGIYKLSAEIESNLTEEQLGKLRNALTGLIQEKLPGMNYVFSNNSLDANGKLRATSLGYRYQIHAGFRF